MYIYLIKLIRYVNMTNPPNPAIGGQNNYFLYQPFINSKKAYPISFYFYLLFILFYFIYFILFLIFLDTYKIL